MIGHAGFRIHNDEYEGTSGSSIVFLWVQWYCAVCLNENEFLLEQESDYCLISSNSLFSTSIGTFHLISSFSIVALCLWTFQLFIKPMKSFHHADVFCSQLLTPVFRPVEICLQLVTPFLSLIEFLFEILDMIFSLSSAVCNSATWSFPCLL